MAIPRKKLLLDVDLNAMIEAKVNSMLQTASITGYPNFSAATYVGTYQTGLSFWDTYTNQQISGRNGLTWTATKDGWISVNIRGSVGRILVNGKVIAMSIQGDNYSDIGGIFPVKANDYVMVIDLYKNEGKLVFMPNR